MMEGYYGRERHEVFDADGWYRTGDFVVVDADGFFYFKGRRGDMIKTSGANVSPLEVEEAIRDLTGLTAHVIGIADDSPRPGRCGGAPRAGRSRRRMWTSCAARSPRASPPTRCRDGSCSSPTTRSRCCRAASSTGSRSRPSSVPGDEWTIPRVIARRRHADPQVQALVSDDRSITYAELDDASRALASRLVRAGLGKGDRVGLLMPNGIEWATVALAVMRVGAVLVPLSTLLRPPRAARPASGRRRRSSDHGALLPGPLVPRRSGLALTGARRSDPERAAGSGAAGAAAGLDVGRAAGRARGARAWSTRLEDVVRPADDMVILFTSGSRGAPKGVIHTHGSALRATAAGLEARCIGAGERLYIPMPFFWTGGFSGGLLSVLIAGATLLTESTPEPSRTIRFLERERVTLFRGWPDQAARIAAHTGLRHGRSRVAAPGEPRSGPAACAASASRGAREPLRHDRVRRPVLRRAPGPRSPGEQARQLRPPLRGHRAPHRRPRERQRGSGGRAG